MNCKTVYVRGADKALHRFALISVDGGVAFVCKEEFYEAIKNGHREPPGIGFPLEDVYVGTPTDLRPLENVEV